MREARAGPKMGGLALALTLTYHLPPLMQQTTPLPHSTPASHRTSHCAHFTHVLHCISQISGDPKGFDLTGDGERWEAAGGDEISDAAEFPTALYEKWVEVLEAAAPNLEWEPAQWEALWKNLQKGNRALARAGLDFGDSTGMSELQDIGE